MNYKAITERFWIFGPTVGVVGAILVTSVFTLLDWIRNFSNVFRDESGTHWNLVYETAVSWFMPSLIYLTLLATLGHLAISGVKWIQRRRYSRAQDTESK